MKGYDTLIKLHELRVRADAVNIEVEAMKAENAFRIGSRDSTLYGLESFCGLHPETPHSKMVQIANEMRSLLSDEYWASKCSCLDEIGQCSHCQEMLYGV